MRKRCRYRGCREYVGVGVSYCPNHKPYGPGWAALRAGVLRRDDHRCRCDGCGSCAAIGSEPCDRQATTVDHINGMAQDNATSNLRAMCRPCNTAKGGMP